MDHNMTDNKRVEEKKGDIPFNFSDFYKLDFVEKKHPDTVFIDPEIFTLYILFSRTLRKNFRSSIFRHFSSHFEHFAEA